MSPRWANQTPVKRPRRLFKAFVGFLFGNEYGPENARVIVHA